MSYRDLREFLSQLESRGELKRISVEVSPRLEMTEICDRVLKSGGRFSMGIEAGSKTEVSAAVITRVGQELNHVSPRA